MTDGPENRNPEFRPGENVMAAVGRMLLWLDLHPDTVNVAGEIGSSRKFNSDGWPHALYAVDRRDLAAVLNFVKNLPDFQLYASRTILVCEACDTNVTYGDEDPRLHSLVEAAGQHACDPVSKAAVEKFRAARESGTTA